jgi:short-subunit dehydrogenase
MKNASWVLITGASTGIGKELAVKFARQGHHLVLVARSAEKLSALSDALSKQHQVRCVVIPKDLTAPSAPEDIFAELLRQGIQLDVLINNAGAGRCGRFENSDMSENDQIIDLNIRALTSLTHHAIHHMHRHGGGKILNVASTGAYQPGPYIAVYYATKAYVLSFTQALRKELKGSGITVSALCPGSTATEFSQRAGKADIRGAISPQKVADCAYKGLYKGKAVIIPGFINKLFIFASKLLPGCLSASIVARVQRKLTESY